ncbi:MAG: hypothetical protein RR489_04055 [Clostridia bacterium]
MKKRIIDAVIFGVCVSIGICLGKLLAIQNISAFDAAVPLFFSGCIIKFAIDTYKKK